MKLRPIRWVEERNSSGQFCGYSQTKAHILKSDHIKIYENYSVEKVSSGIIAIVSVGNDTFLKRDFQDFESAKKFCENERKKFWNTLLKNMMEEVFMGE